MENAEHSQMVVPGRPMLRRVTIATVLVAMLALTGCAGGFAGNAANDVYHTAGNERVVKEIKANFPGAYDITHVWSSDNPNYMQWRMPNADGSMPIGEGHIGRYCTADASQTYSYTAGGGNQSDTPDTMITVPYCRLGVPLGG